MRKEFSEVLKLIELGSLSAAEELVGGILEDEPGNAEALFLLGRCFLREYRLEESRGVLEQAIARSPDFAMAHVALAEVFRLQHFPRLAELHLILALSLMPENRAVIRKLATLYRQIGRVSEAEAWAGLARSSSSGAIDEFDRALECVRRGQLIRADIILSNLTDHYLPVELLGDLAPEEIRDRRAELARLYLKQEGVNIGTVRAMLKVLESYLSLSTAQMAEATSEAEVLILLGAGPAESREPRYFLNSIGAELSAVELHCLYYAGCHIADQRAYKGQDFSRHFQLALGYLDSVEDEDLGFGE